MYIRKHLHYSVRNAHCITHSKRYLCRLYCLNIPLYWTTGKHCSRALLIEFRFWFLINVFLPTAPISAPINLSSFSSETIAFSLHYTKTILSEANTVMSSKQRFVYTCTQHNFISLLQLHFTLFLFFKYKDISVLCLVQSLEMCTL